MPLPVAVTAGHHDQPAGGVDPHRRAFIEPCPRAELAHKVRRGNAAGLDIAVHAEAAQLALRLTLTAPRFKTRVVSDLFELVHRGVVIARVIFHRHRGGIGKLRHEVLAAQFDRVDLQLMRGLVDQTLQLIGRLGPTGPAIGIYWHGIGKDRLNVHVDQRRFIVPRHERAVQPSRHRRREGRQVGPHIGIGIGAQGGEVVLCIQRQFDLGHMVAAMGVGHEGFRPARRPFHRPPHRFGGEGAKGLFLIVEDLGAKAAAHVRRHHAQLVLGDAQHEGAHQQADHMRVLAGGIERVFPVRAVVIADGHARLHRVGDEAVVDQLQRGDMGGLVEGLVHRLLILLHEPPVVAEVAGQIVMHPGRILFHRLFHVHHGGQLVDIDDNRLGGVAGLRQRLGHHGGDGLAHMADLLMGQYGVFRLLHGLAVFVGHLPAAGHPAHFGEIRAGENLQHAGHVFGGRGIDPGQPPMGHIRAQEKHMGLAAQVDVIGIAPRPGEKAHILPPFAAGPNAARRFKILWHNILPFGGGAMHLIRHAASGSGGPPSAITGLPGVTPLLCRQRADLLAAGRHDRFDDIVVAGAAADVAVKVMAYLGLRRFRVFLEQGRRRHHHPRRAKAALQPVVILKRLLDGAERAIGGRLPFDGLDFGAIGLDREHGAGFDRIAVHMDHTGAALAGVAAHMGAGQFQIIAQEMHQQRAALDLSRRGFAVHGHLDLCHVLPPSLTLVEIS